MTELKTKENLINTFKNSFRSKGLKMTPQRTVVYEELINSHDHPNVDTLYERVRKRLPDISFDTVYRTLMTFQAHKFAVVVAGLSPTKRYDYNIDKHYHFLCLECGDIQDIMEIPFDYVMPEAIRNNYSPTNTRVIFEGKCKKC